MRQDNVTGAFCIQFDRFLRVMRNDYQDCRTIHLSDFAYDSGVNLKIRDSGNDHFHFREMQLIQKFNIRSVAVDTFHPFFAKRRDYFRIMIDYQESLSQSLEESDQIVSYPIAAEENNIVL